MNPRIARLALIAYLAGGWILPAVHDHRAVLNSSPAAVESSCAACAHCASHRDGATTAERTADNASESVNGVDVHRCGGLCSLCVARTMSSQRMGYQNELWFARSVDHARLFEVIADIESITLSLSARGPPCSV